MEQLQSLKNHLLIAMPQLEDSWFGGTVTYLCEHNEDGAMGIVLNRHMPVTFDEICEQLDIPRLPGVTPDILAGGPVSQENGFILHRQQGNWSSTLNVTEQSHLTTSKDILQAIAAGDGPKDYHLALGYAGWDADQLDEEIRTNSWLTVEASEDILFDTPPEEIYAKALAALGISAEFLSGDAGHA
ncbi:MAG: YqgE/AlgH family protein [Oceanospirillaceae bacterium]|nr:YqgE/AlgH family protein [Oceanospirillaceae bacterium]MBT11222.1 YqgE/AlgH family protein [Oceanospirillaceae bacterium]|tara:strand:- start:67497 stop:68054 length:558 start_codon:yes stop_codon:yes gene_type:complete